MPKSGLWYVFRCLYCQKPFVSPGYEVNAGKMTKYCSNDCQSVSQKRKISAKLSIQNIDRKGEHNSNYKDGRSMYRKYCKDSCELCGRKDTDFMSIGLGRKRKPLLVHHCDMNRQNSDIKNLRTLCFSCHMRVHNPSSFGKYPDFQKW